MAENKKKPLGSRIPIEIKQGKLYIRGQLHEPKIKAPTANQILSANGTKNKELLKIPFTKSEVVKEKGSTFIAYASDVCTFEDINNAYFA